LKEAGEQQDYRCDPTPCARVAAFCLYISASARAIRPFIVSPGKYSAIPMDALTRSFNVPDRP
jgi:hypothetical protein